MIDGSICDRREEWPAIAVGGGLAGAAFAIELARHGREVLVIERSPGAHHSVCGEFLSVEAQALLAYLGIDIQQLGASAIKQFRLATGERQSTTALPFAAAGLSRFRLDDALLQVARRNGAEIVRGIAVTEINPGDDAVIVCSERKTWRARSVALATGKRAVRGIARPVSPAVGFKLHLDSSAAGRELMGIVQLVFFAGGYIGACIVEDAILSIAWVMKEHVVRSVGSGWTAQQAFLARQSSLIGDLISGARPLFSKPVAVAGMPFGFLRSDPAGIGIYPVGDQLAVVPALTGDGMAIALYSGLTAARAVLDGQPASIYQRNLAGLLKGQFRVARGVNWLLQTPAVANIAIGAAERAPFLVEKIIEATRLKSYDALELGSGHR
jgi:flavin-dependent dehydrogenase